MGLAAIDPHSQKEHIEIRKRLMKIDSIVSKIQPFQNVKIYKEMYGHLDTVRHSVRMAIHFFVNFDVFKSLYLSQN